MLTLFDCKQVAVLFPGHSPFTFTLTLLFVISDLIRDGNDDEEQADNDGPIDADDDVYFSSESGRFGSAADQFWSGV